MMLSRSAQLAAKPQAPRVRACQQLPSVSRAVSVRAASLQEVATKAEPAAEPAAADPALPDVQPSTKEVTQFINTLVADTSIAELHLQVGTFELKVRRSTGALPSLVPAVAAAPAPPPPAPYSAPETLVITKAPPMDTLKMTIEESMDESVVPILSPKVGVFRRGKYAGGKRVGKGNQVNVGDQVKKGQALGYVEQLGTFVAIEAPQAGEIAKFLLEDGAPVEFRQEVVELAPFFGGHIIGDSKYA